MPKFKVFFTEQIDNLYSVIVDAENEQEAEHKFEDREYDSDTVEFVEELGSNYQHFSNVEIVD